MLYVRDYGWKWAQSSNPAYLHLKHYLSKVFINVHCPYSNKRLNENEMKSLWKSFNALVWQNRDSGGVSANDVQ